MPHAKPTPKRDRTVAPDDRTKEAANSSTSDTADTRKQTPPPLQNPAGSGAPLLVPIDLIDEDPSQPRTQDNPGFSPDRIAELAATFGPNGPKSPISLRNNLAVPGRYLINHGARRTRAGRLKGLEAMPAFIDNNYSEVDQVIENLQRDNLTPREVADWIGRELARGKKKTDIAKSVGKSAAFVSQHVTLLNLPDQIAFAFNAGRAKDVTVVNELVTAFKKNPDQVTAWLSDAHREITRSEVRTLREFLQDRPSDNTSGASARSYQPADGPSKSTASTASPARLKKAIVQIEYKGRPARLLLSKRPSASGLAWIKHEDDGHEREVDVLGITLKAIIEG
jgi:ParB family chromosome partitioning protein